MFEHIGHASHTALLKSHYRGAIMLTLLLVCSFSSTQVQKYLAWVLYCGVPSGRFSRRFAPQNDIKLMQRSLSLNKAMLRQILILRLVSQKPRLKWWFCGYCVIPRNALYVIARSNATWQSPGRVTLLIIWWFLSNCQKDTLAIIYNRCVLININTREYDVKI